MIENTFFSKLFDADDHYCRGNQYENKVFPVFPVETGFDFFTVNPINEDIDFSVNSDDKLVGRRADINVTKFRNFMFEIDVLHVDDQKRLLETCNIPWTTITFSGGKSLHAIISLEKPLDLKPHEKSSLMEYKKLWKKVAAYLNGLACDLEMCDYGVNIIDSSCSNPSRFTRFPNSFREDKNALQEVRHVGERISMEQWEDLLDKCPSVETSKINNFKELDYETESERYFMLRAPVGLINTIKYVTFGAETGAYHPVFKLTTWAIDEVNPSYEVMIGLAEKYIIPKLITRFNYYDKTCLSVYLAIEHAYRYKNKEV